MARPTATVAMGAGLSTLAEPRGAAREAAREAIQGLGGRVDLGLVFVSADHHAAAGEIADVVRETAGARHLVGCVSGGVLAGGRELESGPAVAVWAAELPGATIEPFHALPVEDGVSGVPDLDDTSLVVLLADPFTFPAVPFLEAVNERHARSPFVGGLATGTGEPGGQALLGDGDVFDEGAVGVAISGVDVTTIVSQGCAPLGPESVVTEADGNVVLELAGRPALERLREIVQGLSEAERRLAAEGLLVGLVIDENKAEYGREDYLMRGVLGADDDSGAVAIGAPVRVGQTLRFHARDASSADDDLRSALAAGLPPETAGALLFTCNGRGTRLFGRPDHDAEAIGDELDDAPAAGFFAAGEIGPVGGESFLHSFTATVAVFPR